MIGSLQASIMSKHLSKSERPRNLEESAKTVAESSYLEFILNGVIILLGDILLRFPFDNVLSHVFSQAHLLEGRASAGASVDSARQNLAATFVNAFVNAGFGQDKLMTVPSDSSSGGSSANWLFKNKEHGKTSAAASLSMILLWDVDAGLAQIDKYFHLSDNHVISGALLGVGIVNCGIKNDCDPALALLGDYVDKTILEILAVL
ncbi:26S proteasome non-ATPase regulatory subunit 2 homolog A-like [Carya illinoinensis]|uniref:26S proteasome non-ATPase regulatory subunit 2 homolog A-like n=1 Tax=Carya illinoinensis TaxID=32201 RepID=UPI001C727C0F|nr:26S proteasome non-ATPase regulatory subunit 2 homolog A-like [Carya illinoinensis]